MGGVFAQTLDLPEGETAYVDVALPRPGEIVGTVSRNGQPLAFPVIVGIAGHRVRTEDGGTGSGRTGAEHVVPAGETEWRLEGLLPGTYAIEVEGTGLLRAPGVEVEVKPGETATAAIDVARAVTLIGRVVVEGATQPDEIRLSVAAAWREKPHWFEMPLRIGEDGTFRLENVPETGIRFGLHQRGWEMEQREIETAEEGIRRIEFRLKGRRE
jgi:hypothetical protein